jgi:hypothetical protein
MVGDEAVKGFAVVEGSGASDGEQDFAEVVVGVAVDGGGEEAEVGAIGLEDRASDGGADLVFELLADAVAESLVTKFSGEIAEEIFAVDPAAVAGDCANGREDWIRVFSICVDGCAR